MNILPFFNSRAAFLMFMATNMASYPISVEGSFCIDEAFVVQVDTIPPAPEGIEGPDEICPGVPTIFSVPDPSPGITVHWEVDNGQIINGNPGEQVTVVFDPNPTGPYKIRARSQNRGCASEWVEKTLSEIVVDFQITGAATVCSSSYSTYSVDDSRGDTYKWRITPDYLGSVTDQDHSEEVEILWNNVSTPTVATLTAEVEICGQTYFDTFQVTVQMAPDVTLTAPVQPGTNLIFGEIFSPEENPCGDSRHIVQVPSPTAVIEAPSVACPGKPVQFTATVNDLDLTYLWDFNDRAKNSLPDPVRVFSGDFGSSNVTLTVTNRYGCSITVHHPINIVESNMDGEIFPSPATGCIGETILLEYHAWPGTTLPDIYHWTFNGNTVTTALPTFLATHSGEYVVDGEIFGGCYQKRLAAISIAFLDTPVADITGPAETSSGSDFQLKSRRNNPAHAYAWTRNGQPLPQFNGLHSIVTRENSPGVYTYGLTIRSESGCSDTDQFTLTINPL